MADMTFDQILDAALRLSREEQENLANILKQSKKAAKPRQPNELSDDEWEALFDSLVIDKPVNPDASFERADWYDDGE